MALKLRVCHQEYGMIVALYVNWYLTSLAGKRRVCGSTLCGLALRSSLSTPIYPLLSFSFALRCHSWQIQSWRVPWSTCLPFFDCPSPPSSLFPFVRILLDGILLPSLQFAAYNFPFCFWQTTMHFPIVGTSIIWPDTIVADLT